MQPARAQSAEPASKYDIVVRPEGDDVHARQVRWVGEGMRILECGCNTGYVSRLLTARGCHVVGIELDPIAAEAAREHCAEVLIADLDDFDFAGALGGRRFDVVLFGDVLEHLKNPWTVLERVRTVLEPAGRVIACIPNIAERNVILDLMTGRFEYRRLGILDETHLRFFTAESVRRLFESTGYVIQRLDRVENEVVEREVPVDLDRFPPAVLDFLAQQNPDLRTIQFLVEATPATEAARLITLRAELERAQEQAHGRTEELRQLMERGHALEVELQAVTGRLATATAEYEQRLVAQQACWATEIRATEERWQARLADRTTALEAEITVVAQRELHWHERAYAAEAYSARLASNPVVRIARTLGRLFRRR
ncbi:MAG: methyltransferase domain-containing protein [Candidatus Binatia bacterium]